jgi:hypothetical protein
MRKHHNTGVQIATKNPKKMCNEGHERAMLPACQVIGISFGEGQQRRAQSHSCSKSGWRKMVILMVVLAPVLIPLSSFTVEYLKLIDFDGRRLWPI